MYQIVMGSPVHCQITDGIIGSRYRILPMTYHRADYAHRLAGAMHDRDYRSCGDNWFYVIEAGQPALSKFGRENRATRQYDMAVEEIFADF
jgi:hypothetical protein